MSSRLFSYLLENGVGIIQLPCPETTANGLIRWPMGRQQYDNTFYRKHCKEIMQPEIDLVEEFVSRHYQPVCFLAVEGSPNCGLSWGSHRTDRRGFEIIEVRELESACEVRSSGINVEILAEELRKRGIYIPFMEVPIKAPKDSDREASFFRELRHLLGDHRGDTVPLASGAAETS
ncbi:hypothetical protein CUJ83_02745 [Methanocella sp. CWC-04]|uniref:DUF523 domain-containing protein n=1 Tax=Methanooceanicella nereidis TaxID=2052831 RepID=A0AAP2RC86_9EURY|nr:hypothetical protein [Methanocella sp. CWC-04]